MVSKCIDSISHFIFNESLLLYYNLDLDYKDQIWKTSKAEYKVYLSLRVRLDEGILQADLYFQHAH